MMFSRQSLLDDRNVAPPQPVSTFYFTTLIIVAGVLFGVDFIPQQPHRRQDKSSVASAYCNWDGVWYTSIAAQGYSFDPSRHSNVAFFPALPILARCVMACGVGAELALLMISHLAALITAFTVHEYLSDEEPYATPITLTVMFIWPMSLFLRMGYSESLLLLASVLLLTGIKRRWPLWTLSVLCGFATATRSAGIALLIPLVWECWTRTQSLRGFVPCMLWAVPLACWGIVVYMGYLQLTCGDSFAFVQTQQHWSQRPYPSLMEFAYRMVVCEPIWDVYVPSSPAYWARDEHVKNPVFSLSFWNPIYFLLCATSVAYGAKKKWLTIPECLLAAGLLGIPYFLQGHRMLMQGHGRFTCVVFPMFIVLGRLMARWPSSLQAIAFALMAVQLFYWSALFAAWHRVF